MRDPADNPNDPRHQFIARVVKDKSFIDIGGLYLGLHERCSVAHAAGARSVALMDVEPWQCEWWKQVGERLDSRGVKMCELISGDIMTREMLPYDVVHSSGVIYHLPNPIGYLSRLRQITREHCILASSTMPTRMEVDGRELRVPSGALIFLPGLPEGPDKDIIVEWYRRRRGGDVAALPVRDEENPNAATYYPNWFMPTVDALRAMAAAAGFEIVDEAPVEPEELSHCLLLRPA